MKTVMLDNPNTLKPEVGSQMPESGMAAAPATPQPPKLNLGVIGTAEELPPEEYLALLTHEQIIRDEFKNSIDVGLALIEIRDWRLYRIEYGSFPEYYRKKWRFDKRKVCFLSATAEVYKSVTTGTNLPSPEYAFQMRPLLGLAPDQARLAGWCRQPLCSTSRCGSFPPNGRERLWASAEVRGWPSVRMPPSRMTRPRSGS